MGRALSKEGRRGARRRRILGCRLRALHAGWTRDAGWSDGRRCGPAGDRRSRRQEAVGSTRVGAGAELGCLPLYSPDLNPIVNAFAKLKAGLRSAAARTVDDIEAAIRRLPPTFKPDECVNYLAAAGYQLT
jgi:hypothetical protein